MRIFLTVLIYYIFHMLGELVLMLTQLIPSRVIISCILLHL